MGIFVKTEVWNNGTLEKTITFPSFVDPLFLTIIVLLSLPSTLFNPFIFKVRLQSAKTSIPGLLFSCLAIVDFLCTLWFSSIWIYRLAVYQSNQESEYSDGNPLDYFNRCLYYFWLICSAVLLCLVTYARFRAIKDPFEPVSYQTMFRLTCICGFITFISSFGCNLILLTTNSKFPFGKFYQQVGYWRLINTVQTNSILGAFVGLIFTVAVPLFLSMYYVVRTVLILKNSEHSSAESQEIRAKGIRVIFIMIIGQAVQLLIFTLGSFLGENPYYQFISFCHLPCFVASYTATLQLALLRDVRRLVRTSLAYTSDPQQPYQGIVHLPYSSRAETNTQI